jgi:REP element-mobilizing transposase RayT
LKWDSKKCQRRSIRLKGYDYGQAGAYFITVCTRGREYLFGEVVDGEMKVNEMGKIVRDEWLRTGELRSNFELDAFVIMPNHFHGIIVLQSDCKGVLQYAPTDNDRSTKNQTPKLRSPSQTVGTIVRGFKSASTKRVNALRNMPGLPVWQRNYYEHIIRNEESMNLIREYIVNNPLQWEFGRENPNAVLANSLMRLQKEEPWRV